MHCRTPENAVTYPLCTACSGTPALSLFSTEQRRPALAAFSNNNAINLPNILISGLIKPRSENIVQILVATFALLALLPHSFYVHSILRLRLNLRLADPQVDDFPFSIISIILLITIDGSTARRCIAIVTNERRASYVIPLNSS